MTIHKTPSRLLRQGIWTGSLYVVSHGSFVKSHLNQADSRVRSCYYDTYLLPITLLLTRYYAITNMNSPIILTSKAEIKSHVNLIERLTQMVLRNLLHPRWTSQDLREASAMSLPRYEEHSDIHIKSSTFLSSVAIASV